MNDLVIASSKVDARAAEAVETHLAKENEQILPLLVAAPAGPLPRWQSAPVLKAMS